MPNYTIVMHNETYNEMLSYMESLKRDKKPGQFLQKSLANSHAHELSPGSFLELLIRTKRPRNFAEIEVVGDGADWNQDELSLLGSISIVVPVTVYDDGEHRYPSAHKKPFKATLLFTPGALLRNGKGQTPVDWGKVTCDGKIHPKAYYQFYEKKLLPLFKYANDTAMKNKTKAFITIPGIGCGQFAGPFRGQLNQTLKEALFAFLYNHGNKFQHIKGVYYDPYSQCENERHKLKGIDFLVRPLMMGNAKKPQLCRPTDYEETKGEFSDCELFSIVAWDHVSWPGNDFYSGLRSTDDGVKSAATDAMLAMTGIEGKYDISSNKYNPPSNYEDWGDVIRKNQIRLKVADNFNVYP